MQDKGASKKYNTLAEAIFKKVVTVFFFLSATYFAHGQVNIAPQATVTASSCLGGLCASFNNQNTGTCGQQQVWVMTTNPPSTVPGVNFIQWQWPSQRSVNQLIIHNSFNVTRVLTGATIQRWDGVNWVNHHTFSNLGMNCINTVTFPPVYTNRLRITSFQMTGTGQTSNPSFREIEIMEYPMAHNDAGVSALLQPTNFCPGQQQVQVRVNNYGANQITQVQVNWEINGVAQTPVNLTQLLDTLGGNFPNNRNVTLGNITLVGNTTYNLKIWTSAPNNATDTMNSNDTLVTSFSTAIQGTYTINSGLPTGGANFNSFGDLTNVLNTVGVCGPVIVNVVANTGPYNEQVIFGQIPGVSATNTVTINGNGNSVNFSSSNANQKAVLTMEETKHVTINDLNFDANGTNQFGWAAHLIGADTEFITFNNCEFVTDLTITSFINSCGLIIGGGSLSPLMFAPSPSNITVDSCRIIGGGAGLIISGNTTDRGVNNIIRKTEIRDFNIYGIFVREQIDLLIEQNEIHRPNRTNPSNFIGTFLMGTQNGTKVSKNRYHTVRGPNTTTIFPIGAQVLQLSSASGTVAKPIIVSNNKFYNLNAPGALTVINVIGFSNNLQIYHNTIGAISTVPSNGWRRMINILGSPTNLDFRNNLVVLDDVSTGQQNIWYVSNQNWNATINHNSYHLVSRGNQTNFAQWGFNNNLTFAQWQAIAGRTFDAAGNTGDPLFVNYFTDLTPTSAIPNQMGANLQATVPDDFFGTVRTATPDAGAIEFVPAVCDPPDLSQSCVSRDTGQVSFNWIIPPDTGSVFHYYYIYRSTSGPNGPYTRIDSVPNYLDSSYTDLTAPNGPAWYYVTTKADCPDESEPSDTVATMWLDIVPMPPTNTTHAQLSWNTMHPDSVLTFEVWREYPAGIWNMIATTSDTSFLDSLFVCGKNVQYQIRVNNLCVSNFEDVFYSNSINSDIIEIDSVSVINSDIVISWQPTQNGAVTHYLILSYIQGQGYVIVDTVPVGIPMPYTYPYGDPDEETEQFKILSLDSCGNVSDENLVQYHRNMLLRSVTQGCDGTVRLFWGTYKNWSEGVVYEVYMDHTRQNGLLQTGILLGTYTSDDSVHTETGLSLVDRYCFYIRATDTTTGFSSTSNKECFQTIGPPGSRYLYLGKADTRSNGGIDFKFFLDPAAGVRSFVFERADAVDGAFQKLFQIDRPSTPPWEISFTDYSAEDGVEYYYRVVSIDSCGRIDTTSNLMRPIVLNVIANGNMSNTLYWNRFIETNQGVERYEVYRRRAGNQNFTLVTDQIPGTDSVFMDDIRDLASGSGKFCYYIRAVEYLNEWEHRDDGMRLSSRSNITCVVQETRVFIPNAFNPASDIESNRQWRPTNVFCKEGSYVLSVTNRWGQEVFYSTDPTEAWDGKTNGEFMPIGTYVFYLRYQSEDGVPIEKRGVVNLLR